LLSSGLCCRPFFPAISLSGLTSAMDLADAVPGF
jgi:hypothetical protein